MKYISTRGRSEPVSFENVLLAGMAPDGGLFIPERWPEMDAAAQENLAGQSYDEIAAAVIQPFIGGDIAPQIFHKILQKTYIKGNFTHSALAPLVQTGPSEWILELFHGPTIAFKDYALQLLGNLFDYVLEKNGQRVTIVGATSGDTGSAAIEACRGCKNIDIFILHPRGRVSEVQRRQMTTVDSPNVHNIALEGTFDDCQALVKAMFADAPFRDEMRLSAVNSINWARIVAQCVYYFAASLALGGPGRPVSFAVPTGNFGNVYAAWVARQMGLNVGELIIGTNRNDILTRFFETGSMKLEGVNPTISPSMDIQVSSNFERYLCDLLDRDHGRLCDLMQAFRTDGAFSLSDNEMATARKDFTAGRCSEEETAQVMKDLYRDTGYLLDPHTAVGLHAARASRKDPPVPVVIAATAHPAKFPDAVQQATGIKPELPPHMADLFDRPEFMTSAPNDLSRVQDLIRSEIKKAA